MTLSLGDKDKDKDFISKVKDEDKGLVKWSLRIFDDNDAAFLYCQQTYQCHCTAQHAARYCHIISVRMSVRRVVVLYSN